MGVRKEKQTHEIVGDGKSQAGEGPDGGEGDGNTKAARQQYNKSAATREKGFWEIEEAGRERRRRLRSNLSGKKRALAAASEMDFPHSHEEHERRGDRHPDGVDGDVLGRVGATCLDVHAGVRGVVVVRVVSVADDFPVRDSQGGKQTRGRERGQD